MTPDPTPEKIRQFIADRNMRRHAWAAFQHSTRRTATRMICDTVEEPATTNFHIGQRVRTTVNAPAGWDGTLSAPTGTHGTIVTTPDRHDTYGVLLDSDPHEMPASYTADELTPDT